ncbi:hypothetical protein [Streptomyces canus]|uniref:hypothetical protein n=1 Tax=Streptomyces canus TaxID=58343 RepID=UPI00225965EF|nr:hypothetical protein [Streptomyces canus]MCX4856651.1 hypothetical protein [Streptomyces canus]
MSDDIKVTFDEQQEFAPANLGGNTIDAFFAAMRNTTRWNPVGVSIEVSEDLVSGDRYSGERCLMLLVPTMIRLLRRKEYPHYEYAFEGKILTTDSEAIWVCGELLMSDSINIDTGLIKRLPPGQEIGVEPVFPRD